MKFWAVLMLLIYAMVSTPVREFVKLPELYLHYLEHRSENKNISFSSFFSMHYDSASDHAQKQHQNLPFKSTDNISFWWLQVPEGIKIEEKNTNLNIVASLDNFILRQCSISQFQPAIWQPPRS